MNQERHVANDNYVPDFPETSDILTVEKALQSGDLAKAQELLESAQVWTTLSPKDSELLAKLQEKRRA